ncbi:hypothetical protein A2U01_0104054, partial [Trifolium medium]|nr:hypothetical protein [Trifolium medium]
MSPYVFVEGLSGTLGLSNVATRTNVLRAWRCWSAKVFGYDELARLTTAVTRKLFHDAK